MNSIRLLASTLVIAAASPAFAQPAAEPQVPLVAPVIAPVIAPAAATPANAAPHNEAWSNVSHINGQLVKVGERGEYLVSFKKTNISTNPIGWIFGFYGISASTAVSNNIAIRGDVNVVSIDHGYVTGYEVGGSAPIYFKRVYQGPFLEPGIIVRSLTSGNGCDTANSGGLGGSSDCGNTRTLVGPEVLFGWHWTFDSGLNVAMAIGAARNLGGDKMSSADIQPAGYFRVGYAF